jgi:hypothetical protein
VSSRSTPLGAPSYQLYASSRQFQKDGPWGFYCADETAGRHNAASPEDTQDGSIAYARFPPLQTRYADGWLPDELPRAGTRSARGRNRRE